MDKLTNDFPGNYLVQEQTRSQRITNHILFWLGFLGFHLLFFLPRYKDIDFTTVWVTSYGLYYLRFIPVYYLSSRIYLLLKKRFNGRTLFMLSLLAMAVLIHFFTALVFYLLERFYQVSSPSDGFKMLQVVYGKPFWQRSGVQWLYFIYDFQEIQLLFLPLGLKMLKFGVKEQIRSRDLKNQQLQNEVAMLRMQPSSHFILNALNTAYPEVKLASAKSAAYLENLIDVLQFSLYQVRRQWISVQEEFESLLSYVHLESTRVGERLELSIFQDGPLNRQQLIPSLLLFTLTENAFKHGVYPTHEPCQIQIHLYSTPLELTFKIINSIPAHPIQTAASKSSGIGLKNTRKRLELYFPKQHQFLIQRTHAQFSIQMTIPIKTGPAAAAG